MDGEDGQDHYEISLILLLEISQTSEFITRKLQVKTVSLWEFKPFPYQVFKPFPYHGI